MKSKTFNAKVCFVGDKKRKNKSIIFHVPVSIAQDLKLKLGQVVKVILKVK